MDNTEYNRCIKTVVDFTSTTYHDICEGTVTVVENGSFCLLGNTMVAVAGALLLIALAGFLFMGLTSMMKPL